MSSYEVFVGTYEHFLLGYKIQKVELKNNYQLTQIIAQRTHTAPIRCIDTKGRYLATGSNDDRICIMDLKLNQEIQILINHGGNVNDVKFTPDSKYLLSASDDGSLIATKTGSWITDKKWTKAHTNKPITYISIHPTGRLALTLGKDGTIRTWNLLSGQQVFTTNLATLTPLGNTVSCIQWSPNGQQFAIANNSNVFIISITTTAIIQEIKSENHIECICWLNDGVILIGLNNGQAMFAEINSDKKMITFIDKSSRVKAMDFLSDSSAILATITSSGELSIWKVLIAKMKLKLLCTTNIGCRPTCLTLIDASIHRKQDDKRVESKSAENKIDNIISNPSISSTIGNQDKFVTVENEEEDDQPIIPRKKARILTKENNTVFHKKLI